MAGKIANPVREAADLIGDERAKAAVLSAADAVDRAHRDALERCRREVRRSGARYFRSVISKWERDVKLTAARGAYVIERADRLLCASCGEELRPGQKFCSECGAKMGKRKGAPCQQAEDVPPGFECVDLGDGRWSVSCFDWTSADAGTTVTWTGTPAEFLLDSLRVEAMTKGPGYRAHVLLEPKTGPLAGQLLGVSSGCVLARRSFEKPAYEPEARDVFESLARYVPNMRFSDRLKVTS